MLKLTLLWPTKSQTTSRLSTGKISKLPTQPDLPPAASKNLIAAKQAARPQPPAPSLAAGNTDSVAKTAENFKQTLLSNDVPYEHKIEEVRWMSEEAPKVFSVSNHGHSVLSAVLDKCLSMPNSDARTDMLMLANVLSGYTTRHVVSDDAQLNMNGLQLFRHALAAALKMEPAEREGYVLMAAESYIMCLGDQAIRNLAKAVGDVKLKDAVASARSSFTDQVRHAVVGSSAQEEDLTKVTTVKEYIEKASIDLVLMASMEKNGIELPKNLFGRGNSVIGYYQNALRDSQSEVNGQQVQALLTKLKAFSLLKESEKTGERLVETLRSW